MDHFGDRFRQFCPRSELCQRDTIVAGSGHDRVVIWQLPVDAATDGFQCLVEADIAVLQTDSIDDDFDLTLDQGVMVQQLHDADHVSEAGQVELCDEQHTVRYFHNSHIEPAEQFADIDDEV